MHLALATCAAAVTLFALAVPARTQSECHVARLGGAPVFVINGKPHSGVCYSSYDTRDAEMGRRAAQFRQAGCTVFNFVVEIAGYGYSPPMWTTPDQWDFAELDRRAHTILKAAPDAGLLPRIYIDAPAWWRQQYPEGMMVLSNGARSFGEKLFALSREGDYPSLASARWLAPSVPPAPEDDSPGRYAVAVGCSTAASPPRGLGLRAACRTARD
jgi:hypothetical protein